MQRNQCVLLDLGRVFSDAEVARMLGVSVPIVRREAKKLGVVRMGRKYVFFEVPLMTALKSMVRFSLESAPAESYPLPRFGAVDKRGMDDRHGLLA